MNKRTVGSEKEELAVAYLKKHGIYVLERNFRCRGGEIDIIGRDGSCYVFFEVKYRKNPVAGFPVEAVNLKKQTTISRVADFYRLIHSLNDTTPVRFDIIAILGTEITWYRNAFEYRRYYK